MKRLIPLLVVTAITGCSTTEETYVPSSYSLKEYRDIKPVDRDTTTALLPTERAGAALREGGYEQVLARKRYVEAQQAAQFQPSTRPEDALQRASVKSYSVYELSRWERFCGLDKRKMDHKDWAFVSHEGSNNVPLHLVGDCKPRSYSEGDYRAAWKASCNNGPLSSLQKQITRETIRPPQVCDS